ncbi:13E12 repeat family protein [Subtercola sp. PAMC28395]|uniref:DUF222 domain-containing protein n=1 Tax=Subtercola sp. PAMC28395 TaxID=2846775 RepID=UPI001C0C3A5B|nr:DUF222 domain-containing protein [Subtercola sp. PAMC28395]QWT24467.1 13E12 repeat family protein [Subtercola sp. PAMC28395]
MLIDSNLVEVFPRSAAVEALLSEVYSGMVRDEALFASVTAEKAAEAVMFAEPEPESVDARGSGGAERHGVGASSSSQSSGSRSSFAVLRDGVSRAVEAVVEVEADISALMARRARLVEETCRLALAAEELVLTASVLETGTRSQRDSLGLRSLVAELGCALRVPEASVHRLLTESEALCSGLPSTFQALHGGFISYRHVQVMVDNAQSLPEEARLTFEGAALPSAVSSTAAQFGVKARKLRERLHPESMVARRVKAAGDRCVRFEPARDGMAWLTHYLPAAVAVQIDESVDALARGLKSPEETRTHAQLRSDVLTDLILDSATLNSPTVLGDPGHACSRNIHPPATNAKRTTPDLGTIELGHDQRADDMCTGHLGAHGADTQGADTQGADTQGAETQGAETQGAETQGADTRACDTGGFAGDGVGVDATASTWPPPGPAARLVGRGVRPTVIVTVPVMTLLGHTDEPGDLSGYGPIDAETARELARHAPSLHPAFDAPRDRGDTICGPATIPAAR